MVFYQYTDKQMHDSFDKKINERVLWSVNMYNQTLKTSLE